jgi:CRP-like cAMP-binding protein
VLEFPGGFPWLAHFLEDRPEASRALAGKARRRDVAKGALLKEEGRPNGTLSFFASGRARVRLDAAGRQVALGTKQAGDFVGELGLIQPGPATATVEATSPVTVYELTHDDYVALRRDAPAVAGALLSAICCDVARRLRRSRQMSLVAGKGDGVLVPELSAMYGVDRASIAPVHVPRSAHGHTKGPPDASVLRSLRALGAFTPPEGVDPSYAAGLERDLERLASFLSVQEHRPGDVIVRAGERADGVFVILDGRVRVQAGRPDAWFHVDRELGPGSLFGQIAFFDDGLRAASCTALTPLRLAVIYPAAVQMLLTMSEQGQPLGVYLIDWFARQLASDARAVHDRLRERVAAQARA